MSAAKTDPKIKKIVSEVTIAWKYLQENKDALDKYCEPSRSGDFMKWVKTYYWSSDAPVPRDDITTAAKGVVDAYRALARASAKVDVQETSIVIHGTKPLVCMVTTAKIGYLLGRVSGTLGVCWEAASFNDKDGALTARLYMKALHVSAEQSYKAWIMIQEHSIDQGV